MSATRVAFVFAGQGAQWPGMGCDLLDASPDFRAVIERCDAWLHAHAGWSLVDELRTPSPDFDRVVISTPATVAIDLALAGYWRAHGIEPAAVIGHCAGEIAAAAVCGALSIEDALRVATAYGEVFAGREGSGAMGVVGAGWAEAGALLDGLPGRAYRAIRDSVSSTVLAGEPAAIAAALERAAERSLFAQQVRTRIAPHCPLVDDLMDDLRARIAGVIARPASIPIYAQLASGPVPGESLGAQHWVETCGSALDFSGAVDAVLDSGIVTLLEVGPHPLLRLGLAANLAAREKRHRVLGSLQRRASGPEALHRTLAALTEPIAGERPVSPKQDLPPEPARLLESVRAVIAGRLGLPHHEAVPVEVPLTHLGMDSLAAVALRNALEARFGLRLPPSLVLQYPTANRLTEHLASLIAEGHTARAPAPVVPDSRSASALPRRVPLAPNQLRLYALDGLLERPETYNTQILLRIDASIDAARLERALEHVIARHGQLRAHVVETPGGPRLRILPWVEVPLEVVRLPGQPTDDALESLADERGRRPFDLTRPPLIRVTLVQSAVDVSALIIVWHHIVCDGWSLGLFIEALSERYDALADGAAEPLPPTADYPSLMSASMTAAETTDHRRWWTAHLAGIEPLDLPTDRPRGRSAPRGASLAFDLPAGLTEGIEALAGGAGVTAFSVLLTAWGRVLAAMAGTDRVPIGLVSTGRLDEGSQDVIGFFVRTLPLCWHAEPACSVVEAIAGTQARLSGALDHQMLPLEEIIACAPGVTSQGTADGIHPLLRAGLVLEDAGWFREGFADAQSRFLGHSLSGDVPGTVKSDLSLALMRSADGYRATVEYRADLFDRATIEQVPDRMRRLLDAMVEAPTARLSTLEVITPAERALLAEWNDTARPFRDDACIHALFAEQAERTPDAIAVVFEDEQVTYRALFHRANAMAWHLLELGVGPEVRVGVCLERSVDAVASLLGVLMAGGVHVPLDAQYPDERLAYMARDAGVSCIVARSDRPRPWQAGARIVDPRPDAGAERPPRMPETGVEPANLAYVIYTSGTTGRPKGVAVSHAGLPNLVAERARWQLSTPGHRTLAVASFAFDGSVQEVLTALTDGGTVVLASPRQRTERAALVEACAAVDAVILPPALLARLDVGDLPRTLRLGVAGEAMGPEAAARWTADRPLDNFYGPTEATVTATVARAVCATDRLPLGRPIGNTRTWVLDTGLRPLPVGVPGELYIAGVGLARGYLGRPGLTAERFLPDPFGPPGSRMYRTGDRARWRADGNLEFLGRLDFQVKIRGFRIELGEIEAALGAHPSVQQCVVLARADDGAEQRLVAYVVGDATPVAALRGHLGASLPDYMIPSAFVWLDAIPLTPNGKVDRKALPAPGRDRVALSAGFVGPRDTDEAILADVYAEVLGLERVGVHDDFFELGGNSLLSIRLVSRAAQRGLTITPAELLRRRTVARLALVARRGARVDAGLPRCIVPIRRAGDGPPLVLFAPLGGSAFIYFDLVRALKRGFPIWVAEAPEIAGHPSDPATLTELATLYADELAAADLPLDGLRLAGYSLGAATAAEVARILSARGRRVEQVVMIDCLPGEAAEDGARDAAQDDADDGFEPRLVLLARHLGIDQAELDAVPLDARVRRVAGHMVVDERDRAAAEAQVWRIVRTVQRNRTRIRGWRFREPGAPLTLLLTPELERGIDAWHAVLGDRLNARSVPGRHATVLSDPEGVRQVARLIDEALGGPTSATHDRARPVDRVSSADARRSP